MESSSAIGETFGNYRIEGVCGRGGMGVVYRAEQLRPKRTVALKVIAPELAADADFRQRFETESDIAASIEHPNVIPVYEVGEEGGRLYIVMRYIEGTDLREVIKQGVAPERAARIVNQIGGALDAAHARGLVHRDIKPGNILMAGDHAYLTDFGLTKQAQGDGGGPTKTGTWVGSIDYVAPEQIQAQNVDARTDVYALGAVLYHSLVGQVPYPRDSEVSKLWAHMSEDPPRLAEVRPDLSAEFQDVIDRAMAKDPGDRYSSAGDLGRAAVAAAAGNTISVAGERSVAAGNAAPDTSAQTALRGTAPAAPGPTRVGQGAGTQPQASAPSTQAGATAAAGTAADVVPPPAPSRRIPLVPVLVGVVALIAVAAVAVFLLGGSDSGSDGPLTAGTLAGSPVAIPAQPTSIGGDDRGVWVASGSENTISRIDPKSGEIDGEPVEVGGSPYGVAVGEGAVWTANAADDTVSRVDPASRKAIGSPIDVGDVPADLAVGLGSVWVANNKSDTVTRIDARSGEVQATISVGDGPTDVAVGRGAVWVTNAEDDTLSRLNPSTNKATSAAVPVNEEPESVGVGPSGVWVGNIRTDTVTRVDPATGQVDGAPIRVGERPDDVLVADDGVYVVNQDGDSLVKIDPESGEVSEPLAVGNAPIALAAGGGRLWIANLDAETVVQVQP